MSKTNLERVQPTPGECTTLSWEPAPKNSSQFYYDTEHELMGKIRQKITDIWAEGAVALIPKRWQMESDIVIPLESWADADETIIPFWYGTKPEKRTLWKSIKRVFW